MAPRGTGLLEQHFTLNLATKTSKTGHDYNCNYCDFLGKGWQGPARARAHLSGEKGHGVAACPNVPKDVKEKLLKEAEEKLKQKEHQQNKKRIFLSQQNPDAAAEPSPKKQATLDNLQGILKTELDVFFAEFMYHAGIPFHISEDVMLRRYIDKLIKCVKAGLPGSQLYPPNRHKLADGLLDTVYDNISKDIGPVFAADHHTGLATDGYSNIRRQSVINYNLIERRGSVFVKADYPGKQVKNADHIAQGIHHALEVVRQLQLPCPTSTVVADNAAVMQAALNVLDQSEKFEVDHFLTKIGCTIHGYNLLFKDLCALPTVKDVITKCRTVLSFFRNRFRASGILKDEQKKHKEKDAQQDMTEPPLPGDTRFATNYPCLKFMVENKGPLQSSVVSPDWSNTKWSYATSDSTKAEVIAEIVLSTTFWKLLLSCRTLLQPLARMIRKADTEGSTYNSLVYYDMLLFQQHVAEHQGLPKPEHKQAQSLVLERWKFLHHPVHSASYVLNPALMTREEDPLKDSEIRNDVAQVFESFGGKEHAQTAKLQLQQFLTRCGEFADERLWTKESLALGGLNWFQAFCYENSVLEDIALRVHSTPTVASAAERNWSVFGFVHSKSRNRPYGHKVEKLVYIYQNMRLLRKIRDPAFREPCVLPDHMFEEDEEEEE